jgi:hypothetical protein
MWKHGHPNEIVYIPTRMFLQTTQIEFYTSSFPLYPATEGQLSMYAAGKDKNTYTLHFSVDPAPEDEKENYFHIKYDILYIRIYLI